MRWYKHMEVVVRSERSSDHVAVTELIRGSFRNEDTLNLVTLLKGRKEFVRDLSLVAEINGILTGYILLSPVQIQTPEMLVKTLWLEPVCVHSQFRKRGIGSMLVHNALAKARRLDYESVFVTGPLSYYEKFGFKQADHFGIVSSLYIPSEAFLALELKENSLSFDGKLLYPKEIFD